MNDRRTDLTKQPSYQRFLSNQLIQCEHCGGTMIREKWGFNCRNCEQYLTNDQIHKEIYHDY